MMLKKYEYPEIWTEFSCWVEQGLIPDISVSDLKTHSVDKLDHLIFKLFGLEAPIANEAVFVFQTLFDELVSDSDVEWVFSKHAYTIYRARLARMDTC